MLITYLIFFIGSILFKIFHWPGASLLLLVAPIFPMIDLVIQLVKKRENKSFFVLSSITVFSFSLFFLFRLLNWPFSSFLFIFALIPTVFFLIQALKGKIGSRFRLFLGVGLFLFAVFHVTASKSKLILFYMIEDPFDRNDYVPVGVVQNLAFALYQEGKTTEAKGLVQRNIAHLEMLSKRYAEEETYMNEVIALNLEQSAQDLEAIKKKKWDELSPVIFVDEE